MVKLDINKYNNRPLVLIVYGKYCFKIFYRFKFINLWLFMNAYKLGICFVFLTIHPTTVNVLYFSFFFYFCQIMIFQTFMIFKDKLFIMIQCIFSEMFVLWYNVTIYVIDTNKWVLIMLEQLFEYKIFNLWLGLVNVLPFIKILLYTFYCIIHKYTIFI